MATMTRAVPKTVLPTGSKLTEGTEALSLQTVFGVHTGHNSAAALVENGVLKMAMQEERLTRIKNQGGFPKNALQMITARSETDHGSDTLSPCAWRQESFECYWREDILRSEGNAAPSLVGRVKSAARKTNSFRMDQPAKWTGIAQTAESATGSGRFQRGIDHHECRRRPRISAGDGWKTRFLCSPATAPETWCARP